MRIVILGIFSGLLLGLSGCQCYRTTAIYSSIIDAYADTKLALDPLYVPGLDVSRIGMPDWRRFGVNRALCPCSKDCKCPTCRGCDPVYYPAEYRMKYWAALSEKQAREQRGEIAFPEPSETPETELIPLPMPVE
ncbi:MAG TPA: hypothetical protein DD473_02260 [Planctomycetaceae bacterium]|nr:hypothetical protein [Planctomycetaceae bacterium]